jgi:hypothetical protein
VYEKSSKNPQHNSHILFWSVICYAAKSFCNKKSTFTNKSQHFSQQKSTQIFIKGYKRTRPYYEMEKWCRCCEYKTKNQANFKKHLETQKHLTLSRMTQEFICKYCEKEFKFKQSMYRHIKYTCTKSNDEDLKELVRLLNNQMEQNREDKQELQKQIQTQAKQIDKLMGKLEIHGSFNTTNIQNNITLLSYRDTDVSHLTDDDYRKCIKKVNHCVKSLIEKIHFNPLKPENMNIYISNMKDKYLMVFDGMNWNLANKKDELDKLYEEKEMMLEEWLDSNPDADLKDKFLKYINNKEIDECLNQIKEEIKLMLYNKSPLLLT